MIKTIFLVSLFFSSLTWAQGQFIFEPPLNPAALSKLKKTKFLPTSSSIECFHCFQWGQTSSFINQLTTQILNEIQNTPELNPEKTIETLLQNKNIHNLLETKIPKDYHKRVILELLNLLSNNRIIYSLNEIIPKAINEETKARYGKMKFDLEQKTHIIMGTISQNQSYQFWVSTNTNFTKSGKKHWDLVEGKGKNLFKILNTNGKLINQSLPKQKTMHWPKEKLTQYEQGKLSKKKLKSLLLRDFQNALQTFYFGNVYSP